MKLPALSVADRVFTMEGVSDTMMAPGVQLVRVLPTPSGQLAAQELQAVCHMRALLGCGKLKGFGMEKDSRLGNVCT